VPNFSLRRYDTQARVGLWLSLLAVLTLAVMIVGIFQHFSTATMTIYYGQTRKLGVLGLGMVTILLAGAGFGLGLNSAGQRRNDKAKLSWLGFFLGAAVMCLTVILLFFFLKQGQQLGQ
jgi:hypothetical protein